MLSDNCKAAARSKYLNLEELENIHRIHVARKKMLYEQFPIQSMTPEEYAARNGHNIFMLGSAALDHGDATIARWFDELQFILMDDGLLDRFRRHFLSRKELTDVYAELERQRQPDYEL